MNKLKLFILLCTVFLGMIAQENQPAKKEQPKYDRKEEIIYDGKRYRIHNSYLTIGGGFLQASIRPNLQKMLGIDYQLPIRKTHFQLGIMMSGDEFASNNNVQGHVCYGIRQEKNRSNLAFFFGPSYSTGVEGDATGSPKFYQGFGGYVSIQAVTKFTYDIGFGAELFGDISAKQNIIGLKFIAFFSGAYRGAKKNFNPHVRSENP